MPLYGAIRAVGTAFAAYVLYRGKASCDDTPGTVARTTTAADRRRSWMARGNTGAAIAAGKGITLIRI